MADERMPFDIEDALLRLWMLKGAEFNQGPIHPDMKARHLQMVWESTPFLKALMVVGRNHQQELEREWRKALTEPMPFGGAPLGADYHPPPKREG